MATEPDLNEEKQFFDTSEHNPNGIADEQFDATDGQSITTANEQAHYREKDVPVNDATVTAYPADFPVLDFNLDFMEDKKDAPAIQIKKNVEVSKDMNNAPANVANGLVPKQRAGLSSLPKQVKPVSKYWNGLTIPSKIAMAESLATALGLSITAIVEIQKIYQKTNELLHRDGKIENSIALREGVNNNPTSFNNNGF